MSKVTCTVTVQTFLKRASYTMCIIMLKILYGSVSISPIHTYSNIKKRILLNFITVVKYDKPFGD